LPLPDSSAIVVKIKIGSEGMNTVQYQSPQAFLAAVEGCLMEDEVMNNLPLGILHNLVKGDQNLVDPPFLAAVLDENKVQLVLVRTTSHLVLSGPENQQAVAAAIDYLIVNDIPVPSIIGPRGVAGLFAEGWRQSSNSPVTVEMAQRIYRLNSVSPMPPGKGFLRLAAESDLDTLIPWINEFAAEALNEITENQALLLAKAGIADGTIFIWQNGEAVSMAKKTRPTPNGAAVSLVYTPPEHRKKGYATSCVAALNQRLLDEGYKFCSLYTDLNNPTSNKIYMDIGYKPVGDSVVYRF
jgi:predicted GNAT family acetyltransferase